MNTNHECNAGLPIRRNLTLIYTLSFIIAILMAAASVMGLLYRAVTYPTDDLLQSFVPNDVVNLFIGLPILLGSIWLARRGKLIGLLFWPGALFFLLLQPMLTAAPFVLADVVVIFILGLICFIPFALFVRGVVSGRSSPPM